MTTEPQTSPPYFKIIVLHEPNLHARPENWFDKNMFVIHE